MRGGWPPVVDANDAALEALHHIGQSAGVAPGDIGASPYAEPFTTRSYLVEVGVGLNGDDRTTLRVTMAKGKFQPVIAAVTPTGWLSTEIR